VEQRDTKNNVWQRRGRCTSFLKVGLIANYATVIKALAQPWRVRIAGVLTDGERCVCEL
jgi:hypothetical protein